MVKAPKDVLKFLRESNAIENVFNSDSLDQAILAWDFLIEHDKLTHDVVLKTHKILMLNQALRPNEKGYYRRVDVTVGGRICLDWQRVELAIDAWIDVMNSGPAIDWKQHHIEYEKIHPFVDGNGRTGRMFLNWERVQAGMPILVIKNSEKGAYYNWFI